MADTKISGLPASTTPLAGTEELPIVQSGVTKKVSVANLTAGRAISATEVTLTNGNLIVTNGKGIDFSATPGTGTSEVFSDYEEGTWTPVIEGTTTAGTATYTTQIGRYTKIGNRVFVSFFVNYNSHTGTGNMKVTGLPFAAVNLSLFTAGSFGAISGLTLPAGHVPIAYADANAATMTLASLPTGGTSTAALAMDATAAFAINLNYQAA